MPTNSTVYQPGMVQTNTQVPGAGGPGFDASSQLSSMMRWRQAMAEREMAMKEREARDAARMRRLQMQAMNRRPMTTAPARETAAPKREGPKPFFVKYVQGGPGIIGGYQNVPAGTVGAVAGGYLPEGAEDPGAKPGSAVMHPGAADTPLSTPGGKAADWSRYLGETAFRQAASGRG